VVLVFTRDGVVIDDRPIEVKTTEIEVIEILVDQFEDVPQILWVDHLHPISEVIEVPREMGVVTEELVESILMTVTVHLTLLVTTIPKTTETILVRTTIFL
jgi:hypothetical protein